MRAHVLDSLRFRRENAFRCETRYAAGTATMTSYDGAAPAAKLHQFDHLLLGADAGILQNGGHLP
jgi:hypothetical protein